LAEEEGADLIVIGSRGRGRIRRALMESVSDSVVIWSSHPPREVILLSRRWR
jgi:universal stress protein family protein